MTNENLEMRNDSNTSVNVERKKMNCILLFPRPVLLCSMTFRLSSWEQWCAFFTPNPVGHYVDPVLYCLANNN
jgi:hypothetical protein